jgi:cell division protein FtsB
MAEARARKRVEGGLGFKVALILALPLVVWFAYAFVGGKNGILAIRRLERDRLRVARETVLLKLEREALLREKRLAEARDTTFFERKAREELGMIKDRERVIRFPPQGPKQP